METLYLIVFAIGAIYAVLALFLGDMIKLRLDAGGRFPLLSPAATATFLTVLGGCGFVLERSTVWDGLPVVFLSFVSAIILAGLMVMVVTWPRYKAEKEAAKAARDMIGRSAEMVTVIMHGTKGEILVEEGGVKLSASARVTDGQTVRQGETVRIVDVANGTFVVEKWTAKQNEAIVQ